MKKVILYLLILFLIQVPAQAFAASSSLSFRPGSGNILVKKNFTVDILIDSSKEAALARAVFKYDPSRLQIVKAQRNASLFCSYPEDEQSIDNTSGLLMITGFCQSGVGQPYKTSGSADVMARITFKAIKTGGATLSWQYSGQDEPFKSVIMKDGSPPTNLLTDKPRNASFQIVTSGSNSGSNGNPSGPTNIPNTGIKISLGLVAGGIAFVLFGLLYTKYSQKKATRKLKTVVTYES